MSYGASTPNTPFIPPMLSQDDGSPAPVIPDRISPGYSPIPGSYQYPQYPASPYASTPFIPTTPLSAPVVPTGLRTPQSQPSRQGVSHDYTGYPGSNPYGAPGPPPPLVQPPMTFHQADYGPPSATSWGPAPSPANYPAYGGTPWHTPGGLPSTSPWPQQNRNLQPPPQQQPAYTPAFSPYHQPPPGPPQPNYWGGQPYPSPQEPYNTWQPQTPHYAQNPYPNPYAPPPTQNPGYFPGHYPPINHPPVGRPPVRPPDPPSAFDRCDPFAQGPHYGPVLDPFLARAAKAQLRINPLISPLPEDGSDQVNLKWNMLFPTSTVQRSTDPPHISWSNGRDAPATFPRVTSLRLVSDTIPWMMQMVARDKERGITCGEVIDGIGREMNKLANKGDYSSLPKKEQVELTKAYAFNRSRDASVPGGQLGQGMKRLDYLRRNTMFAGIGADERAVKRICGELLPCTFVMKCAATFPMTQKEKEEQEARKKAHAQHGQRPRANSRNGRINVAPPSDEEDSEGSEDVDDRGR